MRNADFGMRYWNCLSEGREDLAKVESKYFLL
ncbi:MAG: hypothetical protein JWO06_1844 [Bacteroidota bacterium]|nr:hypothetical protein [Bacteroidota bacterium]